MGGRPLFTRLFLSVNSTGDARRRPRARAGLSEVRAEQQCAFVAGPIWERWRLKGADQAYFALARAIFPPSEAHSKSIRSPLNLVD